MSGLKRQPRRGNPDPAGCAHIILPGSVCMSCWACISTKQEAKSKEERTK